MSEHHFSGTATDFIDDETDLERVRGEVNNLDFESGAFDMPNGARFEPMLVPTAAGVVQVLRYRYDERVEQFKQRRETYFALQDIGRPILLFMPGDLAKEAELVDNGDFAGVIKHHAEQARKTALGFSTQEVKLGATHDIHHFSMIVREAVSQQRALRQAS